MTNNSKMNQTETDFLFQGILALSNLEECYSFFEDLCTIQELKAMSQRFTVAKLLRQGITYTEVAKMTGASTATISRVNKSLAYGAGGYGDILDRIEK
ncbi:MAG: helix-turn-helix domain-containing protein [Clostridia bacterium]|nr:helix-turn-helix domain-containing protein [Clostridia bacterium]